MLKKEHLLNMSKLEMMLAGASSVKRQKYRNLNARLLKVVSGFHSYSTLDYLRAISHNYVLVF